MTLQDNNIFIVNNEEDKLFRAAYNTETDDYFCNYYDLHCDSLRVNEWERIKLITDKFEIKINQTILENSRRY